MRKYCNDKTKIENYELAKADDFKGWVIHHRFESHFSDGTPRPANAFLSMEELKALDMYWERPPEELVYMRTHDHRVLHMGGAANSFHGKQHSDKTRRQIAESLRGNIPWNKGKKGCFSEETRRKMSESARNRRKGK